MDGSPGDAVVEEAEDEVAGEEDEQLSVDFLVSKTSCGILAMAAVNG